jgi:hypothetical protein
MTDKFRRTIWTRESQPVDLCPITDFPSLGVGREERTLSMISEYADSRPVEMREPVRDVYLRAYRRAGLIPGDPTEITAWLPPERDDPSRPTRGMGLGAQEGSQGAGMGIQGSAEGAG